jgi:hypothetical protein
MNNTTEHKINKRLVIIWIWDLIGSIETLKLGFLYRKEKV